MGIYYGKSNLDYRCRSSSRFYLRRIDLSFHEQYHPKRNSTVQIFGRGGTSFQPVFDYLAEHNIYDGLIILTDGGAPHPTMDDSIKAKILWVCEDENSYNLCKDWMQLYGRVCWMYL